MKPFPPLLVIALLVCWHASAQMLPALNVSIATNRTAAITWPYTNSGFIFQESSTLNPTSWSATALSPRFNSNNATFSVSAPATNSTEFFRLVQPADPQGIYINTPLTGGPNNPSSADVTNALGLPGVDGMLLTGLWSDLETNFNQYNWSHLDKWMSYAAAQNKKVNLVFRAGDGIPAWLFLPPTNGPGATQLTFAISPKDGRTSICQTNIIAIPWEDAFLNSWNAYLTNLSTHLKPRAPTVMSPCSASPVSIEHQMNCACRPKLPTQTLTREPGWIA